MSRRRKRNKPHSTAVPDDASAGRADWVSPHPPHPPRPNRRLLLMAVATESLWIAALAAMALWT